MKNKVLKAIAYIVGTCWLISACAVDTEGWFFFIVFIVCTLYLGLFAAVNEDYFF